MGGVRISFYPFVIGISFLIPLELLFSCWAFFWIYKIELMVGGIMGWRNLPRFPYASEQAFGAYMAILLFVLWRGRLHFKGLVRHLLGSRGSASQLDDSHEPMPYRLAVGGIVIGMTFLTVFLLQSRDVVVGDTHFFSGPISYWGLWLHESVPN